MKLVIVFFIISILPTFTFTAKLDCYECSNSWDAASNRRSCIEVTVQAKQCVSASSGVCTVRISKDDMDRGCTTVKDLPNGYIRNTCTFFEQPDGKYYQYCACETDKCNGFTEFTYGPEAKTTTTPPPPLGKKPYKRGCVNGSSSLNKYENIYIMGFIAASVVLASASIVI